MVYRNWGRTPWVCAGIVLLSVLSGCGGGGGSSSNGGSGDGSGGSGSSVTGLVPPAPTPGGTLVADATTLRPLVDGAVWSYSGTDQGASATSKYTNTVTQAASGAGFNESTTNAFNAGADIQFVSVSAGTVTDRSSLGLSGVGLQQLSYTELRSPVRQHDQITLIDQHVADFGVDADGDGKHESGDIGGYSVVVGMEDVTLQDGSVQHAVRVDTTIMLRVTASSTGQTSPPVQAALQSTWYAAGIGIVKQRLTTPISTTSNEVAEEVLSYFDGGSRGLGALPAKRFTVAADATAYPGQALLLLEGVVGFADHALVLGRVNDEQSGELPQVLSSVSPTGSTTHTTIYPMVNLRGHLFALGSQVALLSDPDLNCSFTLALYDASNPQPTSTGSATLYIAPSSAAGSGAQCLYLEKVAVAGDGSRIWLAMVRHSIGPGGWVTDLIVQPFGADGAALASATTLASVNVNQSASNSFGIQSISAAGGKALVSYANDASGTVFVASVTDAGVLTQASFALARTGDPILLSAGNGAILVWQGLPDPATQQRPAKGVLLDATLKPVLSSGGSLDTQVLAGLTGKGFLQVSTGPNDTFLVSSYEANYASGSPPVLKLARYSTGAGALAAQAVSALQLNLSDSPASTAASEMPRITLFQSSAWLLFNASGGYYSKLVWLP